MAYSYMEYVVAGTCSKDFCNHYPSAVYVPRLRVDNQAAAGFVDWAKGDVDVMRGEFAR